MVRNDWAVAKNISWREQTVSLKDREGEITISVSVKYRDEKLIEDTYLGMVWQECDLTMKHGPFCNRVINLTSISSDKNLLHCTGCGLRIGLPAHIKRLGELVNYLVAAQY